MKKGLLKLHTTQIHINILYSALDPLLKTIFCFYILSDQAEKICCGLCQPNNPDWQDPGRET